MFVTKIAPKQEDILGEALIVIVVMIIVVMIAMFVLMMVMKMMTAKQTTIVTVTALDTAMMMIQTVMEYCDGTLHRYRYTQLYRYIVVLIVVMI